MGKTPEYTRRAIKNYKSKFEQANINFEKGTKERCEKLLGQRQFSKFVTTLVYDELERLENAATSPEQTETENKVQDQETTNIFDLWN